MKPRGDVGKPRMLGNSAVFIQSYSLEDGTADFDFLWNVLLSRPDIPLESVATS